MSCIGIIFMKESKLLVRIVVHWLQHGHSIWSLVMKVSTLMHYCIFAIPTFVVSREGEVSEAIVCTTSYAQVCIHHSWHHRHGMMCLISEQFLFMCAQDGYLLLLDIQLDIIIWSFLCLQQRISLGILRNLVYCYT